MKKADQTSIAQPSCAGSSPPQMTDLVRSNRKKIRIRFDMNGKYNEQFDVNKNPSAGSLVGIM